MKNIDAQNIVIKHNRTVNLLIIMLGTVCIFAGILVAQGKLACKDILSTLLYGIGGSIVASAIVALINHKYLLFMQHSEILVSSWGLQDIYKTKANMNDDANTALDECKKCIDIIGEGLSSYRSLKGGILEDKIKKGVRVRIISCDSEKMLIARANDERSTGSDAIQHVQDLNNWVEKIKSERTDCDVVIRYHSTYPGLSYLRIDSKVYVSINMWERPSQLSFAICFDTQSDGGIYFTDYFDELWEKGFSHDGCNLPHSISSASGKNTGATTG